MSLPFTYMINNSLEHLLYNHNQKKIKMNFKTHLDFIRIWYTVLWGEGRSSLENFRNLFCRLYNILIYLYNIYSLSRGGLIHSLFLLCFLLPLTGRRPDQMRIACVSRAYRVRTACVPRAYLRKVWKPGFSKSFAFPEKSSRKTWRVCLEPIHIYLSVSLINLRLHHTTFEPGFDSENALATLSVLNVWMILLLAISTTANVLTSFASLKYSLNNILNL